MRKRREVERVQGVRVQCYALPESAGWDRWTVVFPGVPYSAVRDGIVSCVGMSGHSGAHIGRHLGRRVSFDALPESLRRVVVADCSELAAAPVPRCWGGFGAELKGGPVA